MSQVYSISIKLAYLSTECAKQALLAKIANAKNEHVNYDLDHYRAIGLDLDNVHDLARLFFGGWDARLEECGKPGWLHSGFNASYGWEDVMLTAFMAIAPYLEDGSELLIDVDEGRDHLMVKDGGINWLS